MYSVRRAHFSTAGYIIPTVTGSISFLSSSTIVFFILRSRKNTVYHRILCLMSFFDMVASIAMAATTIPMPSDVSYPFDGPTFGTTTTCEIQGFMYFFGSGTVMMLGALLNIYYVSTLRYNMEDATFRRRIESFMYPIILASMLTIDGLLWKQDSYNPTPSDPFCAAREYPDECTLETNTECRGSRENDIIDPHFFIRLVSVITILTILVSTALIIHSFARNVRRIKERLKDRENISEEEQEELQVAEDSRRTITKQVYLYLGAFFITWIFLYAQLLLQDNFWIVIMRLVFQPLQGFWNMLIFFYHKIHLIRKDDEDKTVLMALSFMFKSSHSVPCEQQMIGNIDFMIGIEGISKINAIWNDNRTPGSREGDAIGASIEDGRPKEEANSESLDSAEKIPPNIFPADKVPADVKESTSTNQHDDIHGVPSQDWSKAGISFEVPSQDWSKNSLPKEDFQDLNGINLDSISFASTPSSPIKSSVISRKHSFLSIMSQEDKDNPKKERFQEDLSSSIDGV